MSGMIGYALGYDAGRSDEQTANHRREIVHQILYGERPVTVDQSYIDRLHAALADASSASDSQLRRQQSVGNKRPSSSKTRRCTGGTRSTPP